MNSVKTEKTTANCSQKPATSKPDADGRGRDQKQAKAMEIGIEQVLALVTLVAAAA